MLKKTIEYKESLSGESLTEDFYFHLDELDVVTVNLVDDLKAVAASKDPKRILPALKRIVGAAIGQRIGNKFVKSEEYSGAFLGSGAYSQLIIDMITDSQPEKAVSDFIKGIVPGEADLNKLISKLSEDESSAGTE